jgi:hypothetical protein
MTGNARRGNAVPLSDLATPLLDPLLRKRAGLSLALVQSWEEIAGPQLAARSRPEKMQWPRRVSEDDPYQPATLVIACEGIAALHIQHETNEIIARVNGFLGFAAIGRIRIVQKPIATGGRPPRPQLRPPSEAERKHVSHVTRGIEDDELRRSLERLGERILTSKR